MDIQTRKINFVVELLELQDEEIISAFEKFLSEKKPDFENPEIRRMSLEEFHTDIELSLHDLKKGRTISAKELKEQVKEWD